MVPIWWLVVYTLPNLVHTTLRRTGPPRRCGPVGSAEPVRERGGAYDEGGAIRASFDSCVRGAIGESCRSWNQTRTPAAMGTSTMTANQINQSITVLLDGCGC